MQPKETVRFSTAATMCGVGLFVFLCLVFCGELANYFTNASRKKHSETDEQIAALRERVNRLSAEMDKRKPVSAQEWFNANAPKKAPTAVEIGAEALHR